MRDSKGEADGTQPQASGRRRFVEFLLGGGLLASAISFLYPVLRYLIPPAATDLGSDTVVAGHVGELKRNTGKIFRFGNRPALLVLTADGEYRAMSATCTHLSCTVQYRSDLREVWCPCHNGFGGRESVWASLPEDCSPGPSAAWGRT